MMALEKHEEHNTHYQVVLCVNIKKYCLYSNFLLVHLLALETQGYFTETKSHFLSIFFVHLVVFIGSVI